MEATVWRVFAIPERANQRGGQKCCRWGLHYPHGKEQVVWPCATEISMILSMFLFLSYCALDIFATANCESHGGEYRLETRAIFHF